jgi:16S rRNA (guanine527-N7)-methyltransferase
VNTREFQERLTRRARRAGATVPPALGAKLEAYYRLLATWNRKINLTGMDLTDPIPEALDRLLIEPIVAAKHASASARVIDIGSGGGSPAIPFALAIPRARLLMVESKIRKSVFLKEAIRLLEMDGSDVVASRYEALLARPELHETHDVLTVRAVRLEMRVLMGLQAFVKRDGHLFLFQSQSAEPTMTLLTPPLRRIATVPLVEDLHSRLILIRKELIDENT